jgi:hypothetical protein
MRFGKQDLAFTERRTEISSCRDERAIYEYLRDNPCVFQSLVSIFAAGETQAQRENTRLTTPVCGSAHTLFSRCGIERNGVDYKANGKETREPPENSTGKTQNGGGDDGKRQQVSDGGLNYEVQSSTRPGLGTFATIVGNWADVQYLRSRTPYGYTSLITTAKQVNRAVCTALPGELISLIPNKREDATGMQVMFCRNRTEGVNIRQEEIDLLSYALTAIANCTGDGMPVRQFEAFRNGIRSRRESLLPVAFNDRDNEREELVASLFDELMVKAWDYASGVIPF